MRNVEYYRRVARRVLGPEAFGYLAGGSDDERTLARNERAFARLGIRVRRLVDVRETDTRLTLLGEELASPILLAPVGFQRLFHPEAERATARAAAARGHRLIVSSASYHSVEEIAEAGGAPVWFQLYPTPDRRLTKKLLERAEAAGCRVVVLTVDVPAFGNRERHGDYLARLMGVGGVRMGNYEGIRADEPIIDPGMTWQMVDWLRGNCEMRVVLKGIVTRQDARLALERGADGLIVSNHGGRQEESDRATIECLPEVVEAVAGRIPVLLDGGIRRGTDVLKALAQGADAVCIGRPYIWGLSCSGQPGVEAVLEILQTELIRAMQLAGRRSLAELESRLIQPGTG